MKSAPSPKRDFEKALLVSLLLHVFVAALLVGLGTVLPTSKQDTQVEWAWTAPGQQTAKPNNSPSRPQLTPSEASPPNSVPGTASPKQLTREPGTTVSPSTGASSGQGAGTITGPNAGVTATAGSATGSTPRSAGPGGNQVSSSADFAESQIRGEGLAIVPPRLKERPPIQLPPSLAQPGLSGEVLLLVEVGEDGRVGKVSLLRSSGNKALDELARQNVLRWLFDPAWQPQGSKPVRVSTSVWVRIGKAKE